ncbi:DapH/DapD/GlmU-related protein [Vibrio cyclitrophicus]
MKRLYQLLYYFLGYNLPCSKFSPIFNRIRVFFLRKLLDLEKVDGLIVERRVNIGKGDNLSIGYGCEINEEVFIQGAIIGNNVLIAPRVSILSKTHNYSEKNRFIKDQGDSLVKIPVIEDDVWIGRNAVIMPGVKLEKGSVVGAGAIVTKDVPSFVVVGGVPAKRIGQRI